VVDRLVRLLVWPALAVVLAGCAAQAPVQSLLAAPAVALSAVSAIPAAVAREATGSVPPPVLRQDTGLASFYYKPQPVSCGGDFDAKEMTAAHRTLPCGTLVKVTNLENGRRNFVWITDRGPYIEGRIIDLSRAAARDLGMIPQGVVPVKLEVVP
jgi:rare lipoprotein A